MHLTSNKKKKKVLKGYFTVDVLHFELSCANENQDSQKGPQEQTGTFTMHVRPLQVWAQTRQHSPIERMPLCNLASSPAGLSGFFSCLNLGRRKKRK